MEEVSLSEFVSDYLAIEGAAKDSNNDIANAYLERCGEMELKVTPELEAQVAYYRPEGSK